MVISENCIVLCVIWTLPKEFTKENRDTSKKNLQWVSYRILNLKSVKIALIYNSDLFKSIELSQILNLKFGEKLGVVLILIAKLINCMKYLNGLLGSRLG